VTQSFEQSLDRRLEQIIHEGSALFVQHQQSIQDTWQRLVQKTSEYSLLPWADPHIGHKVHVLAKLALKYVPMISQSNIQDILHQFREECQAMYPEPFDSNEVILILSLLENIAHQIVHRTYSSDVYIHQAIHYLFTVVGRHLLRPETMPLHINSFLQTLFDNRHMPLYWIARVYHQDGHVCLRDLLVPKPRKYAHPFKEMVKMLKSPTAESLADSLLCLVEMPVERSNVEILNLPMNDETLLVATDKASGTMMKTFLSLAIDLFKQHQTAAKYDTYMHDALILYNESIMQAKNLQETLELICAGFVRYLPFERAALFSYSYSDHTGIGIYGYQVSDHAIRKIKEQISNIPLINHGLRKIQPIYVPNAAQWLPKHYVEQFQLESVVITPLFSPTKNKMLGAIILDQGEGKPFRLPADTLNTVMTFSRHAAETLTKYLDEIQWPVDDWHHLRLSPREYDVLKLMADGASISEAAKTLYLSEYTVRDYVTSAMKKLNAKNRTHAVALALRLGLIS